MSIKTIKVPIYDVEIVVLSGVFYSNIKGFLNSFLPKEKVQYVMNDIVNTTEAITINFSDKIVIYFRKAPSVGMAAHEAFHASEFIMQTIGCAHGRDSSEPWAYLVGYIASEIFT